MTHIFVLLYPLVAFIYLWGYIPQIWTLVKATSGEDRLSLQAWSLWAVGYAISLGYGILYLRDVMFSVTMALSMICSIAIVGLALYNRHWRFKGA